MTQQSVGFNKMSKYKNAIVVYSAQVCANTITEIKQKDIYRQSLKKCAKSAMIKKGRDKREKKEDLKCSPQCYKTCLSDLK